MAKGFKMPSLPSMPSMPSIKSIAGKVDTQNISSMAKSLKSDLAPAAPAIKGVAKNISIPDINGIIDKIPDVKIKPDNVLDKIPGNIKDMVKGKVEIPSELANFTTELDMPPEAKALVGQMPELKVESLLNKYEGKEISVKDTLKDVASNRVEQAKNLVETGKRIKEEGLSGAIPPEYKEMGEMFKDSGISIETLAGEMKP